VTPTVAVLITSYNRRVKTLDCLRSIVQQAGLGTSFALKVVLVDASSPDGTATEVRRLHPSAVVLTVPSTCYWGAGMRTATMSPEASAADYIMWLNDDVVLDVDAVQRLLDVSVAQGEPGIVIGQLRGSLGEPTYGGMLRGRRPLDFRRVGILPTVTTVDTFNGNVVLIPVEVGQRLGGPDVHFPHAMGDIDFGLRARRAGILMQQAPGSLGLCELNQPVTQHGRTARLRAVTSVKALPPRAWSVFCLRHAGPAAPAYFVKPYLVALGGGGK
jgi:GT2 family glycosyltransferase